MWWSDVIVSYRCFDFLTCLFVSVDSTPPTITTNEFHELAFKPGEKVELRCEASGDPKPTYV